LLVRLEKTLENKKGFSSQANPDQELYEGPSFKQMVKFKSVKTNQYSAAFVAESDAGEAFRWRPKSLHYGMDFLSGHLALETKGILSRVVFGDYQMNVGQGLTLGHAFSIGKSSETVNIRKNSRGLKPYSGSNEYNFFRGMAATLDWNNISFSPFFSNKFLDARINIDPESGKLYAASIINSGMHRTNKELAVRQKLSEMVYGMDLSYNSPNRRFEAGVTMIKTQLGMPFIPNKSLYNQFTFSGNELLNSGIRFGYNIRNIYLFGEMSAADFKNFGGLTGLQAVLTPQATLAFLYRNYGKRYFNFYGQAFGESSTNNEEGYYWGLKVNVIEKLKVNFYYDVFRFPWMKYQVYTVSSWGSEFLSRISYFPSRSTSIYFQYKTESKEKNTGNLFPIHRTTLMKKDQFLLNMDLNPATMINMRFRIQGSVYDHQRGMALSQDINVIFSKLRWYNRLAIFDTQDYDNRQYMYEKDVLYAFTFPALHGKGIRYYSMIEYKASKKISCWIRIARTRYYDCESIGTGLEEIQGPRKTDFKLQARYVF
jgi:hypothetical protein